MKKRVIWLTGSMSCGKSTQRRNLCNALANAPAKVHTGTDNGKTYYFTQFGGIAAIGKVTQEGNGETSQCDGLDSVFGKTKKEGGIYTVDKALQVSDVIVLEGSQTSPSWGDLMQPILKKHGAKLYLVYLHMSYWDNFLRLIARKEAKEKVKRKEQGIEEDWEKHNPISRMVQGLEDKAIESLIGKNRQFNNCYSHCEGLAERIKIIAKDGNRYKTKEEIFDEILDFCFAD